MTGPRPPEVDPPRILGPGNPRAGTRASESALPRLALGLLAALGAVGWGSLAVARERDSLEALSPQIYAARRQRLVERLAARLGTAEKGVFLALGAEPGDFDLPRQDPDFLYLSGVDVSGAALALEFGAGPASETLFLREPTPRERVYDRPPLAPGRFDWEARRDDAERQAALQATGFKKIEAGGALPAWLLKSLDGAAALFVATGAMAVDAPLTPELDLVQRLRERHPALRVLDARPDLTALRLVKEAGELARIEAAVAATLAGFRRAAARVRPGALEAEVQAEMEAGFRLAGAQRTAFPTIVASGPRSTILHYMRNEGTLEEGGLVVIDAGAERGGYAADVTRTFPISGHFDAEQRRLYDKVIEAQEAGMRAARPGVTLEQVDRQVRQVLEDAGFGEAVLHGCCHFVGLEVHDVGERAGPLAEGMVITIEPGIYLRERATGIRVEDTLVVTSDGVRSLSGELPRRAGEVERFLAGAR